MVKLAVMVCDVCHNKNRETTRYTISSAGRRASVDLCDEHAQPLADLLNTRDTVATGDIVSTNIVTMEELEEMKRAKV